MMPFAKAVSAKTHDFDDKGNCIETDYRKMLKIVLDAGYHGHLGIEWEGEKPGEGEGTRRTKRLLERIGDEMSGRAGAGGRCQFDRAVGRDGLKVQPNAVRSSGTQA